MWCAELLNSYNWWILDLFFRIPENSQKCPLCFCIVSKQIKTYLLYKRSKAEKSSKSKNLGSAPVQRGWKSEAGEQQNDHHFTFWIHELTSWTLEKAIQHFQSDSKAGVTSSTWPSTVASETGTGQENNALWVRRLKLYKTSNMVRHAGIKQSYTDKNLYISNTTVFQLLYCGHQPVVTDRTAWKWKHHS